MFILHLYGSYSFTCLKIIYFDMLIKFTLAAENEMCEGLGGKLSRVEVGRQMRRLQAIRRVKMAWVVTVAETVRSGFFIRF